MEGRGYEGAGKVVMRESSLSAGVCEGIILSESGCHNAQSITTHSRVIGLRTGQLLGGPEGEDGVGRAMKDGGVGHETSLRKQHNVSA